MPKPIFDPLKEIPDLSGKVIVITGGTSGLVRNSGVAYSDLMGRESKKEDSKTFADHRQPHF